MSEKKPKIGFIGLGLMGNAFTKRLCSTGYDVVGYDILTKKIRATSKHGVVPASSASEVAKSADIILICVTSTDAVREVVFGVGGVVEGVCLLPANSGKKLLVDHSTTIAQASREMAKELYRETKIGWVDAPVSGGPLAAQAGKLAIMAGGSNKNIARVTPIMSHLAAKFTHMGPIGAGQITKMINQILVLNNYAIMAEALALAEAGGIDAAKIPSALRDGHAGSNILQSIYPRMVARDFDPSGFARQVLKDLDMVQDLAKDLGVPVPMSSMTANLYRILSSKKYGELDGTAVLKLYDPKEDL